MNQSHSPLPARSRATELLVAASLLAASACSEPPTPPAEAAVAISKSISMAPGDFSTCPTVHGRLMFPPQDDGSVLGTNTPASIVTDTMMLMNHGVKCSVKGADGNYSINVTIDEQTLTGVGDFELSGVNVQNGFSTGPASLYWQYQGFGFQSDNCTVNVDQRPPTDEAPDGMFVEPGLAKITFACDPFTNTDNQACSTEGTVFVRKCSK
jgi:hypothetical protein